MRERERLEQELRVARRIQHALLPKKLSEKSRRRLQRSLQATQTVLFGSFWPPYVGQIHTLSVTPTPAVG
jgi:hypothetical protein